MRGQRGGRGALLAALAPLVLLVGMASTEGVGNLGHSSPQHLPTILGVEPAPPPETPTPSGTPSPMRLPEQAQGDAITWLGPLIQWLLIAGLVALAVVIAVRIIQNFHVDVADEAEAEATEDDQVSVDTHRMANQLRSSIDQVAAGGDFRGAIIACWRQLEDLAAESGAIRAPWQSTSEFSVEVLARTPVHQDDLAELAGIYQRACYAAGEPGEAERAEAAECLHRLTAALDAQHARQDRSPWARPDGGVGDEPA